MIQRRIWDLSRLPWREKMLVLFFLRFEVLLFIFSGRFRRRCHFSIVDTSLPVRTCRFLVRFSCLNVSHDETSFSLNLMSSAPVKIFSELLHHMIRGVYGLNIFCVSMRCPLNTMRQNSTASELDTETVPWSLDVHAHWWSVDREQTCCWFSTRRISCVVCITVCFKQDLGSLGTLRSYGLFIGCIGLSVGLVVSPVDGVATGLHSAILKVFRIFYTYRLWFIEIPFSSWSTCSPMYFLPLDVVEKLLSSWKERETIHWKIPSM
jgi:hypothetical protein